MIIDTTFNVYSDAQGGDPDSTSPTLRLYHKHLWSKPLPNGTVFELTNNKKGVYFIIINQGDKYKSKKIVLE